MDIVNCHTVVIYLQMWWENNDNQNVQCYQVFTEDGQGQYEQ